MTPKKEVVVPVQPIPTHGGEYATNPVTGAHEPVERT